MSSDLTYDLRSGDPDSVDHLTAITFANIALDLVADNVSGRMVGIQDGNYACSEIPKPTAGARQVDLDALYNVDRYRPRYDNKVGKPLLLTTL